MSGVQDPSRRPSVAVVGGGLAGLAAAATAAGRGLQVELFEQRKQLGGRVGWFYDPQIDETVDDSQHVSMGCCTNLADFCRRMGVADCFRRYRTAHFFAPGGTRHDFSASRWLPAPLHLAPPLMRLGYLSLAERWAAGRAMLRLARTNTDGSQTEETIGDWLVRQGQSQRAIDHFWSTILVGALSETAERISLGAARKVFLDGFLAARTAYELEVPGTSLAEIMRRVTDRLAVQGVALRLGTPIRRIEGDAARATAVVLPDGTRREFDFIVVAVPWGRVRPLFPEVMLSAVAALQGVQQIQPAAITAVHLWLDRPITHLPHAALVGRLAQWVFNHGPQDASPGAEKGTGPICRNGPEGAAHKLDLSPFRQAHYYQVVISASHELADRSREGLVGEVRRDLEAIWPEAGRARLLHWRVVHRPAAVFSCRPGLDRLRPPQQTPIENLMLAGDWTATGWPATMEGAVRSGYLAIEAVLKSLGRDSRLLVADLPRSRLARLLLDSSDRKA